MKALIAAMLLLAAPAWAGELVMKEHLINVNLGDVAWTSETEVVRFALPPGEHVVMMRVVTKSLVGGVAVSVRFVPQWDNDSGINSSLRLVESNSASTVSQIALLSTDDDKTFTLFWVLQTPGHHTRPFCSPPMISVLVQEDRFGGTLELLAYVYRRD